MPSKTFYNLSEKKQRTIFEASKKEFSRVPLNDALVKNIVLNAGIPRGSFYQYFENIEDCYYYIVDEYAKDIKKELLKNLKKYNGDIIKSYLDLYHYILNIINNKKNEEFFEKLFLNLNYKIQKMFTPNFNEGLNDIINNTDISQLNIPNKFAIGYILDIIESILLHNVVESYKRNVSTEKNIDIFEKEMQLVMEGIKKRL